MTAPDYNPAWRLSKHFLEYNNSLNKGQSLGSTHGLNDLRGFGDRGNRKRQSNTSKEKWMGVSM
jgi:hypothetical protein